jgi:hypothetical protein
MNAFALDTYKSYKVFKNITSFDVCFLFNTDRDYTDKWGEYSPSELQYIAFVNHVFGMVSKDINYIDEKKTSAACEVILQARAKRAAVQKEKMIKISENNQMIQSFPSPSFQDDHVRLHICWMAYWDFQMFLESTKSYLVIYNSIDTVRAFTDCDGISFAVNIELNERDSYKPDMYKTHVQKWYDRITTKENAKGAKSVTNFSYDEKNQKMVRTDTPLLKVIEEIESGKSEYISCRNSNLQVKKAMVDGELVFPHNKWMVQAKLPADKFLSLTSFNGQFKFPSNLPSFVCTRGTSGLNFSCKGDIYRLKLSDSREKTFIMEKLVANNQWQLNTNINECIGNDIIVNGVMFATMDLLPNEQGNRYSRANNTNFVIKINHTYTNDNYPIYASPVAGNPSELEILFPHKCTFHMESIDDATKMVRLKFKNNPKSNLPIQTTSEIRAKRADVFFSSLNGGASRNTSHVAPISVLTVLTCFIASLPR